MAWYDAELEKCVRECEDCQKKKQKTPPVTPLQLWSWPEKHWSRVHIDYAGPFIGKIFLLMIDSHSKWLEVHTTVSTT